MTDVTKYLQEVALGVLENVVRVADRDCLAECYSAGKYAEFEARLVQDDGAWSDPIRGGAGGRTARAWHRLREAMATQSGRGAWFSARVRVSTDGRYSFDFDYDHEPDWQIKPVDETYLEDMERHPRPIDQIPSWHPAHPSRQVH